jgi:hypothetical protein
MKCWQFILATLIFLAGGQYLPAQQIAEPTPVAGIPSAATTAPMVVSGQPYVQTAPGMIEPSSPTLPMYPPGSTVVPLPSQTPGSIFGPPVPSTGSAAVPPPTGNVPVPPPAIVGPGVAVPGQPVAGGPTNTITVPVVDDELAWDQIADVVSDYFKIAREQRARRGMEGCMEGRIDTVPQDSATWLEPHRQDSIGTFNRWESTFQSIRRRATVRVIPDAGSYRVELIVEKEIEDLPRPERSTAGAAALNMDITLPNDRADDVSRTHRASRWLSLGRDPALEQRMLAEIHARLNGITSSRRSLFAR